MQKKNWDMIDRIYLDSAASTKTDPEVIEAMIPYFRELYAIPTSQFSHSFGIEVQDAIFGARKLIKEKIGASNDEEIVFAGSGTEANNLAIKGTAQANRGKGMHLITTKVEHLSVLESARKLEKEGFEVTYLSVDGKGNIDIEELKRSIRTDTVLISIQLGNHETGTVQDIEQISGIVANTQAYLHVDSAVSSPYLPIDLRKTKIDLMTFSPHKFYGPKGIGVLFVREGTKIAKIIDGGFNENNLRAGTENTPAIIGAKKAFEIFKQEDVIRIKSLKDLLRKRIENEIKDVELNGALDNSLPHILNYTFKFVEGESIALRLDFEGIAVTTGSACYSKNLQASYILLAMGKSHEQAYGSIRFSLSKYNNEEEINFTVLKLKETIEDLRKLSPLGKE